MSEVTERDLLGSDDHNDREHPRMRQNFFSSTVHAWHGVVHVIRHERNARIHLAFAVMGIVLGLLLHISNEGLAAVFFAVLIVFLSEVFNTAIERTLDLVEPRQNSQVKLIKDMAAGAVLLAAVGAVFIGIAVFLPAIMRSLWGS